jgi:archaellum component FlaC
MKKERIEELRELIRNNALCVENDHYEMGDDLEECLDEIERLQKDVKLLEKVASLFNRITIDQAGELRDVMEQVQELQMKRLGEEDGH